MTEHIGDSRRPDAPPVPDRRLRLDDAVLPADADRPEAWGEPVLSEADRAAAYEAERPPHHGD